MLIRFKIFLVPRSRGKIVRRRYHGRFPSNSSSVAGDSVRDIDAIITQLHLALPGISAAQLTVLHSGADDDGLWFFRHPTTDVEVQLESSTGNCPFLFESYGSADRLTAGSVELAVEFVVAGLGFAGPAA